MSTYLIFAGDARITPGFELPARFVIHAVGPVWYGGDMHEAEDLASCYRVSLRLASEAGVKTIAFPAISCGAYRYPIPQAARVSVAALAAELPRYPELTQVTIAVIEPVVERAFRRALRERRGY